MIDTQIIITHQQKLCLRSTAARPHATHHPLPQVKHLVKVETKEAYEARLAEVAAAKAPRPPLVVQHSTL